MTVIKPAALRADATFGVVSPASTPKPELVARGIAALHALGYQTKIFPHALKRGPLYYAGTVEERASDLHAAFADPEVDAVICTRGGWGSAELLPLLDPAVVKANPKPFIGYSDQTSLHLWLRNQCGLVSFQGPMVAADLSKPDGADEASWSAAFQGVGEWGFAAADGLRVLRTGIAEGELGGGCCSIYTESLGTPYAAQPRGGVLFLEDIGVKPYQWDRMLTHLRLAGMLHGVTGIVFGDMAQCGESAEIEESLMHALKDFAGPIGIGLRSGHGAGGNITLPFGVSVGLDFNDIQAPRMRFLEAAVTK